MKIFSALLWVVAALSLGGCYRVLGNDEGERYFQRKDTVTLSAGDAKEVNARTHMNDAWPRYVGDRNIPMEGSRAARAIECYRQGAGKTTVGQAQSQTNITLNTGSGSAANTGQETQLRGC